jgi:hypothetical protein
MMIRTVLTSVSLLGGVAFAAVLLGTFADASSRIEAEFVGLPTSRVALVAQPGEPAPYSVLLHNNTPDRHIVGYSVSWTFYDAMGSVLDHQTRSALNGHAVEQSALVGGVVAPLVRPGETFAISLFPKAGDCVGIVRGPAAARAARENPSPERLGAIIREETARLRPARAVVAIDTILFFDGEWVGPDPEHAFESTTLMLDTRRAAAVALVAHIDSGGDAHQYAKELMSSAAKLAPSTVAEMAEMAAQGSLARSLAHNPEQAIAQARVTAGHTPLALRRGGTE